MADGAAHSLTVLHTPDMDTELLAAAAVAWLANKLSAPEITLDAGHVVMPGSCTKAVAITAGDHIRAEFSELGDVSVVFT